MSIAERLTAARIVPVVTLDEVGSGLSLASALHEAGFRTIEVTLRTDGALRCLGAICREHPTLHVGAGTVLNAQQVTAAADAGAQFIVSPGFSQSVIERSARCGIPALPGVSSPSDIMRGLEAGLDIFKFFPAEAAGGVAMLRALSGPFRKIRFCPTGGIGPRNYRDYLALPNVLAVGGTWMLPPGSLDTRSRAALIAAARSLLAPP